MEKEIHVEREKENENEKEEETETEKEKQKEKEKEKEKLKEEEKKSEEEKEKEKEKETEKEKEKEMVKEKNLKQRKREKHPPEQLHPISRLPSPDFFFRTLRQSICCKRDGTLVERPFKFRGGSSCSPSPSPGPLRRIIAKVCETEKEKDEAQMTIEREKPNLVPIMHIPPIEIKRRKRILLQDKNDVWKLVHLSKHFPQLVGGEEQAVTLEAPSI
jgi:transcriptional adapter 2-alpha